MRAHPPGSSGTDNLWGVAAPEPRSSWTPLLSLVSSVLAMLLVAAACGEAGEPYLGAVPTTSTSVANNADASSDEPQPAPATGTPVSQLSPPRPVDYQPILLVGTAAGLFFGEANELASLADPLGGQSITRVADDFFGGLVVEIGTGQVLWFPAEGGEGELVNELGGALLDVGFRDGTPEAILAGGANAIDRLQLVTRERLPLTTLAEGRELLDLSASAGLFALVYADASCGGLLFLNSAGQEVDLAGPGAVSCPVPRRASFGEIGLSPDGDAYVYTEISYRSDGVEAATELVGRELSDGTEIFRIGVGGSGDRVRSVSFDGRRVVLIRSSIADPDAEGVFLYDTANLDVDAAPELAALPATVDAALAVTFARLPLTVISAGEN